MERKISKICLDAPLLSLSFVNDVYLQVELLQIMLFPGSKGPVSHSRGQQPTFCEKNDLHQLYTIMTILPKSTFSGIMRDFHRAFVTSVTCPQGDARSSGHLVLTHLGLACVLLAEINPFPTCRDFLDNALRTSLGTFAVLPYINSHLP